MTSTLCRLCLLLALCPAFNAHADNHCESGLPLTHGFDSGAAWSACAVLDDLHGLELRQLHYRAPGDSERSVIDTLHVAQILMHYHNAADPVAQMGVAIRGDEGMGASSALSFDESNCAGEMLPVQSYDAVVCATEIATGVMAKYGQRTALHGARWQIETVSRRGTLVWTTSISLHEHGVITPEVRLSGVGNVFTAEKQLVPATLLSSWRAVFALDGDSGDQVEEFDFALREEQDSRRPMQVSTLTTETFRKVDRKAFRGWRVRDTASGKGYYLDPANSGYAYASRTLNWAQFDVAFTRSNDCERHALHNDVEPLSCGRDLDEFVDGESLADAVTLWHQQSRVWQPRREDMPAITAISIGFDLLPFDWTSQSPFDPGQP